MKYCLLGISLGMCYLFELGGGATFCILCELRPRALFSWCKQVLFDLVGICAGV